jgi:2-keto-3-deoxy-L-rhamnonate aldolase RhmA
MINSKSLKNKLKSKELTIGSWISFGFTQTCEIMAKAGFDWLVIDMEHTAIDNNQCLNLIQIIECMGVVPLVRIGKNDELLIKRAMDAGAHGIIVPMVNTEEEARKAIDALYYPPIGNRGVGLGRAQNYGTEFESYRKWADSESIFIPQIEHIEGVNNLENILALGGVDGFIVGPYDLSGSLGVPGEFQHPAVINALERVKSIMAKNIKPGGYHVVHSDHDELRHRVNEGYNFIAYGDDMVFFSESITKEKTVLNDIKV